jgi:hypothetical protein
VLQHTIPFHPIIRTLSGRKEFNMQPPSSLAKRVDVTTQRIKRGLADEHTQVPNKAARLGTSTNGSNIRPDNRADRHPLPLHKVLAAQ